MNNNKKELNIYAGELRRIMRSKRVSVRELSEATGINKRTIEQWYQRNGIPPIDKYSKCMAALRVQVVLGSSDERYQIRSDFSEKIHENP